MMPTVSGIDASSTTPEATPASRSKVLVAKLGRMGCVPPESSIARSA
jgi:hypothetical protein